MKHGVKIGLLFAGVVASGCTAEAATSNTVSKAANNTETTFYDGVEDLESANTVSGSWWTEPVKAGVAWRDEGHALVGKGYRIRLHTLPCDRNQQCPVTLVWKSPRENEQRVTMTVRQATAGPFLEATMTPAEVGEHRMWTEVKNGAWKSRRIPVKERPFVMPTFAEPTSTIQFSYDAIHREGKVPQAGGSFRLSWVDEQPLPTACVTRVGGCVNEGVTVIQYPFEEYLANGKLASNQLGFGAPTLDQLLGIPAEAEFLMVSIGNVHQGCSQEQEFKVPKEDGVFKCVFGDCPDDGKCPGPPSQF